jgi:hypothetical protein
MSLDLIQIFTKMLKNHLQHLNDLKKLRSTGVIIQSVQNGQTIDDLIKREESAIDNLLNQKFLFLIYQL